MWVLASLVHRRRRREQNEDFDFPTITITPRSEPRSRHAGSTGDSITSHESMPLLYSLARAWAWQAVTFRCRTNPEEARADIVDHLGESVLHWAAFGRPPLEPVQALLETSPELAKIRNKKGFLPLHIACSYRASAEVVSAILDAYPEAANIATDAGSYPLHLLCDYGCTVQAIRCLLQSEYGITTVTKLDQLYRRRPLYILNGRKNLSLFQRSLKELRESRARQRSIQNGTQGFHNDDNKRIEKLIAECREQDFWKKASLLVLAEFYGRCIAEDEENDEPMVLRAFVESPSCPASLQEYAALLYMFEARNPDKNGKLPLHYAVASGQVNAVKEVLGVYPLAASLRDYSNQLPFSIAIKNERLSWSPTLRLLLEEYPAALMDLGLDDRLYARLLSRLETTEGLFRAVKANPGLFAR